MENIEKNEIINTEAIEDLTTEATSNNGSAIKTVEMCIRDRAAPVRQSAGRSHGCGCLRGCCAGH